jgi:hypothetical protein
MSTTRLQLFRDIGAELGEFIELEASDSDHTTTTFISEDDMVFVDSALNGRESYYASASEASAANRGKRRIVWDTTEEDFSITVNPPWPAEPQEGDILYLVNSRGTGVTVPEIFAKINQLIRRVSSQLATEVADDPATFDAQSPVLAIPAAWRYCLGAQVEFGQAESEDWQPLLGGPLYYQKWDRTATVKPQYRALCQGKRVRLIGAIPLSELEEDDDTVWVPSSWIAKLAAAELLEAAANRTGEITLAYTYGEILKAQAVQLEGRVKKRWSAVGQRIDLEL